jgi:hypothetical protein
VISRAFREIGRWWRAEKWCMDLQLMDRRFFRLVAAEAPGSEMLSLRVGIWRAPAGSHVSIILLLVGAWGCPEDFQRPLRPLWQCRGWERWKDRRRFHVAVSCGCCREGWRSRRRRVARVWSLVITVLCKCTRRSRRRNLRRRRIESLFECNQAMSVWQFSREDNFLSAKC